MARLVKGHVLATAIAIWSLFIPICLLFSKPDVFALTSAMTLTASLAVLQAYWPAMKDIVTGDSSDMDYVDFLTLGIMCSWFAISARVIYILFIRWYYDIPEPLSGYPIAFFQYVNFTGALLHLSARRVLRNSVPTTSTPRILFALIVGGILSGFIMWYN